MFTFILIFEILNLLFDLLNLIILINLKKLIKPKILNEPNRIEIFSENLEKNLDMWRMLISFRRKRRISFTIYMPPNLK